MQRPGLLLSFLLAIVISLPAGCQHEDRAVVAPNVTEVVPADPGDLVWVATPFRGRYETTFTDPLTPPPFLEFTIWGEGVATMLGASTWMGPSLVDLTVVPPAQSGTAVFVAADGSTFLMTYAGITGPGPDATYDVAFHGAFSISDGTGRFDGATGGGSYSGTASNILGVGEITYDGVITSAHGAGLRPGLPGTTPH